MEEFLKSENDVLTIDQMLCIHQSINFFTKNGTTFNFNLLDICSLRPN